MYHLYKNDNWVGLWQKHPQIYELNEVTKDRDLSFRLLSQRKVTWGDDKWKLVQHKKSPVVDE